MWKYWKGGGHGGGWGEGERWGEGPEGRQEAAVMGVVCGMERDGVRVDGDWMRLAIRSGRGEMASAEVWPTHTPIHPLTRSPTHPTTHPPTNLPFPLPVLPHPSLLPSTIRLSRPSSSFLLPPFPSPPHATYLVLRVEVGLGLDQRLRYLRMAPICRPDQGRLILLHSDRIQCKRGGGVGGGREVG